MSKLIVLWDKIDYGEVLREKIPVGWNYQLVRASNFQQAFNKHRDWKYDYVIFLRAKAILLANINSDLENIFRHVPRQLRIMIDWSGKYNYSLISAHRDIWQKITDNGQHLETEDIKQFICQFPEEISTYFGEKIDHVLLGYSGEYVQLSEACRILAANLNNERITECSPIVCSVFAAFFRQKLLETDKLNWEIFCKYLGEITYKRINQQVILRSWDEDKKLLEDLMNEKNYQLAYQILEKMMTVWGNQSEYHSWLLHFHSWVLYYLPKNLSPGIKERINIVEDLIFRNYHELLNDDLFVGTYSNLQYIFPSLPTQKITYSGSKIDHMFMKGFYIYFVTNSYNFLGKIRNGSVVDVEEYSDKVPKGVLSIGGRRYTLCKNNQSYLLNFSGRKGYHIYKKGRDKNKLGEYVGKYSVPWCVNFDTPSACWWDKRSNKLILALSVRIHGNADRGKYIFLLVCLDKQLHVVEYSHIYNMQFLPPLGVTIMDGSLLTYAISEQGEIIMAKIPTDCWWQKY